MEARGLNPAGDPTREALAVARFIRSMSSSLSMGTRTIGDENLGSKDREIC